MSRPLSAAQTKSVPSLADDSESPEGWAAVKLPDVCSINPPKPPANVLPPDAPITFVPMPAVDADRGMIANPTTRRFADVRRGFTAFRDGDVIMAKITPCMENGKAAIARELENGLGFGSTEFHVLRSNCAVKPEYVFHFIRQESFRRAAGAEMAGSVGQKRVPASFLEETDFPLPPLAEQKRIVAKVEELLARVNAARERLARVPTILKRFRQAVLAAACSGRLMEHSGSSLGADSEGRGDDLSKRQDLIESFPELSTIPEDWRWVQLGDLVSDSLYGPRFGADQYSPKGTLTIRTTDIDSWGSICLRGAPKIELTDAEQRRFTLCEGDLLVTRTGATIGKCALYRSTVGPAIPSAYLIRFRLKLEMIAPDYLLHFLLSPYGQHLLGAGQTSVAQPNINARALTSFPVPLPPKPTQAQVVRYVQTAFRAADAIEKRLAAGTARTEKLTQAILTKAFRGELVPIEAELARAEGRSFEPASALLARIHSSQSMQSMVSREQPA